MITAHWSSNWTRDYIPSSDGGLPSGMRFVRVLHELELADNLPHTTPASRPEVRALFPNHFVPFGKGWQLLAWKLNPLLSAGNMTAVYHYRLWISNNNGFGDDTDPRQNYFENTHLDAKEPIFVEALTCGGNILHVLGEITTKTNAGLEPCYRVEVLDYRSVPALEWLTVRPWLITTAVNMGSDGTPRRFSMGAQPNGFVPGVRHPFVADGTRVVVVPKWRCVEWTSAEVPDPYRVYESR